MDFLLEVALAPFIALLLGEKKDGPTQWRKCQTDTFSMESYTQNLSKEHIEFFQIEL
jgi:hypothetical protein